MAIYTKRMILEGVTQEDSRHEQLIQKLKALREEGPEEPYNFMKSLGMDVDRILNYMKELDKRYPATEIEDVFTFIARYGVEEKPVVLGYLVEINDKMVEILNETDIQIVKDFENMQWTSFMEKYRSRYFESWFEKLAGAGVELEDFNDKESRFSWVDYWEEIDDTASFGIECLVNVRFNDGSSVGCAGGFRELDIISNGPLALKFIHTFDKTDLDKFFELAG